MSLMGTRCWFQSSVFPLLNSFLALGDSVEFVAEGLQTKDSNSTRIKLADIHRLPQDPICDSNKRKINRSIIVKFMDIFVNKISLKT